VHGLAERLLKTIRKQNSIRAGDRVAIAVSGGADSVALLVLLLELRAELGIVLSVAHVNHKLRGDESDADEQFVAELARKNELDLHSGDAPVDGRAGLGIEAAARELRYDFFRRLAREGHVTKIATAHTLDDQAETILLRIFRGTGIRGLAGIHPRIVFKQQGSALGEVVRPLLGFRRAALPDFLRERGQVWREDSSNLDTVFLRNRARHRLLPIIAEEFGEAAIEHMGELAEIARAEEECWEPSTQYPVSSTQYTAFSASRAKFDVGRLLAFPLAAQRRQVRAWLEANAPDLKISFRLIEDALDLAGEPAGRKMEMSSGWNLRRGRQELLLESEAYKGREAAADYQYKLPVPGAVEIPELRVRIEAQVIDSGEFPERERGQLLNLELMPAEFLIRNWRAGDRYWPAHTSTEKKVKELLGDRHATGARKKLWPVATAEGCGLVWVRDFAAPAAFQAPPGAAQAIWIREIGL
jgi:tRNA(Ile)-lysidine synthase